jgi:hypothetical protein
VSYGGDQRPLVEPECVDVGPAITWEFQLIRSYSCRKLDASGNCANWLSWANNERWEDNQVVNKRCHQEIGLSCLGRLWDNELSLSLLEGEEGKGSKNHGKRPNSIPDKPRKAAKSRVLFLSTEEITRGLSCMKALRSKPGAREKVCAQMMRLRWGPRGGQLHNESAIEQSHVKTAVFTSSLPTSFFFLPLVPLYSNLVLLILPTLSSQHIFSSPSFSLFFPSSYPILTSSCPTPTLT